MRSARQDGLVNCVTGLGDPELDTRQNTRRTYAYQRSVAEYEQEVQQNWMASREVFQRAGDIFREGLTLTDVQPETIDIPKVMSYIEGDQQILDDGTIDKTKGLLWYAQKLREQGDKVGGAALFVIVDDGLDPVHPLDVRRIQRVVGWEVLDRSELTPYYYGGAVDPEYYVLSDVLTRQSTDRADRGLRPGDVIHRSRLLIHKGREVGRREERLRQGWGASVLELNWAQRRAVEEGSEYAMTYLDRSSWLHMSFAELNELLQAKDTNGNPIGEALLDARMRQFRKIARTMSIAVSDAGVPPTVAADGMTSLPGRNPDKLESIVESTGDMTKIVDMARNDWQAGIGMPKSQAFGDQPSALRGGDNSGDWQSWQGEISREHSQYATPTVNWMLVITFASREGPTGGLIPREWTLDWNPLIVPSRKEKAETALAEAQADNARIEKGVAKPNEVRMQRLVQGDTSSPLRATADNTDLDTGQPPAQVGIAAAVLEAGIALSKGEITPEWYAWYLTVIDEPRFPTETAAVGAKAAVMPKAIATEVEAESSTVSANDLLSAGGKVAEGKMEPEYIETALQILDPETYTPERAAALALASQGGPEALAAEVEAQAAAEQPLTPTEDAGEPETPEIDEVELALSSDPRPADVMSSTEISTALKEIHVKVSAQKITRMASDGVIRTWNNLGKRVHSLGEVRRLVAEGDGLLPPREA